MKLIHYAGDVLLTSDAIAQAVVEYAAALARAESSTELTIPIVLSDGTTATASLLLGPASQLVTQPAVGPVAELDDELLVDDIIARTNALGPVRAVPAGASSVAASDEYGLEWPPRAI